ncbi:hypothetical protein LINPERPRIM_LOCUS31787 [Linum perenne]
MLHEDLFTLQHQDRRLFSMIKRSQTITTMVRASAMSRFFITV